MQLYPCLWKTILTDNFLHVSCCLLKAKTCVQFTFFCASHQLVVKCDLPLYPTLKERERVAIQQVIITCPRASVLLSV